MYPGFWCGGRCNEVLASEVIISLEPETNLKIPCNYLTFILKVTVFVDEDL